MKVKTHRFASIVLLQVVVGLNTLSAFAATNSLQNVIDSYSSAGSALFGAAATTPNFLGTQKNMEAQMNAKCAPQAVLSEGLDIVDRFGNKSKDKSLDDLKSACSKDASLVFADLKSVCALNLDPPSPKSCDEYFGDVANTSSSKDYKPTVDPTEAIKAFNKDLAKASCYNRVASFVANKCGDQSMAELNNQFAALQCQMGVLKEGVAEAQKQVTSAFQNNNQKFQQMQLIEQEFEQQKKAIDEILGPDPELGNSGSAQFGGLIGLQKKMQESLRNYKQGETKFTNEIVQVQEDNIKAEQALEANTMGVVGSCMNGERNITTGGSKPLLCWRSKPSADGKSAASYVKQACGPLEYLGAQVEQSAYMTGKNGQPLRDASNNDEAVSRKARFDGVMQSILRDFGALPGQDDTKNGLITKIDNATAFNNKYANQLSQLAADLKMPGLASMVNQVTQHCFKEAKGWKTQQQRSANSAYRQEKKKISDRVVELRNTLNTGLSDLASEYSTVIGALTGKTAVLNRASCTNDDLDKLKGCYQQIEGNLRDLLEGNSANANTLVTKVIPGGTMVGQIAIQCRGINGCVTDLSEVRKKQKEAISQAKTSRAKYVSDGNAAIAKAIGLFANGSGGAGGINLNTLQSSVEAKYKDIKALLAKMGVGDVPESPACTESENLKPAETKSGEQGPYETPKSMAGVFSSMMSPCLINLEKPGFQDAMKAAKEKASEKSKALKEDAKTMREAFAKFDKLPGEIRKGCGLYNTSSSGGSDGVANNYCNNCAKQANACRSATTSVSSTKDGATTTSNVSIANQASKDALKWIMEAALKASPGSGVSAGITSAKLVGALDGLTGSSSDCSDLISSCNQCELDSKTVASTPATDADASGGAKKGN